MAPLWTCALKERRVTSGKLGAERGAPFGRKGRPCRLRVGHAHVQAHLGRGCVQRVGSAASGESDRRYLEVDAPKHRRGIRHELVDPYAVEKKEAARLVP